MDGQTGRRAGGWTCEPERDGFMVLSETSDYMGLLPGAQVFSMRYSEGSKHKEKGRGIGTR